MVMGAMHTRLETMDHAQERLTAFYRIRARGEAGLILTGGFAPNPAGLMESDAPILNAQTDLTTHRAITSAVHAEGGHIALQILHAGRYGYHPLCVAPSAIKAPINKFRPREMSNRRIKTTIGDFIHCAELAREAFLIPLAQVVKVTLTVPVKTSGGVFVPCVFNVRSFVVRRNLANIPFKLQ